MHPSQATPFIPVLPLLHPQSSGELKQLLVEKLGPNYTSAAAAPPATALPAAAAAPEAEGKTQLQERIKTLLASSPVMLFMKGVPDAPRCGFSRKVCSLHLGRRSGGLLQCLAVLDCFCETAEAATPVLPMHAPAARFTHLLLTTCVAQAWRHERIRFPSSGVLLVQVRRACARLLASRTGRGRVARDEHTLPGL